MLRLSGMLPLLTVLQIGEGRQETEKQLRRNWTPVVKPDILMKKEGHYYSASDSVNVNSKIFKKSLISKSQVHNHHNSASVSPWSNYVYGPRVLDKVKLLKTNSSIEFFLNDDILMNIFSTDRGKKDQANLQCPSRKLLGLIKSKSARSCATSQLKAG